MEESNIQQGAGPDSSPLAAPMDCPEEESVSETEVEEVVPDFAGLVSVIVPVYNVETYLPACIKSILRQSYPFFELLLLDDGSSDSSPQICDEFAAQDSRIRVIHKENTGASSTRNLGIREATGDFIMFVDSDDGIGKRMLQKMVAAITNYHTDLVICGYERFRDDWKQRFRLSPYSLVILQSQLELASVYKKPSTNMFGISIWAKLYRTSIIREHDIHFQEDVHYEEDCLFNLDYFHHVTNTAVLRDYFYFYRQMDVSLSKGYRNDNFPFLLRGYHGRKAYLEELGMKADNLDTILMLVIKSTYIKIYDSTLSKQEKLAEYRFIMDFEETQLVAAPFFRSKSRLTRMIAKASVARKPKRLHMVLFMWQNAERAKRLIKKIIRRIKR